MSTQDLEKDQVDSWPVWGPEDHLEEPCWGMWEEGGSKWGWVRSWCDRWGHRSWRWGHRRGTFSRGLTTAACQRHPGGQLVVARETCAGTPGYGRSSSRVRSVAMTAAMTATTQGTAGNREAPGKKGHQAVPGHVGAPPHPTPPGPGWGAEGRGCRARHTPAAGAGLAS